MADNLNEKDYLQYRGNNVPRLLRFAWTVLIVFSGYYLIVYALPDLIEWIQKTK